MNNSGKTLTIFLVLSLIVFMSATAISVFLLNKKSELHEHAQARLDATSVSEAKLQGQIKDVERQLDILVERNKEADEKINSLLDDLELEEGLREELKSENANLKKSLEESVTSKDQLREAMGREIEESKKKIKDLENQVAQLKKGSGELEEQVSLLEKHRSDLEEKLDQARSVVRSDTVNVMKSDGLVDQKADKQDDVDLERIVVAQDLGKQGRVVSVDRETQFLIFDLGRDDDIAQGDYMSVYRGDMYLGDVVVSRVQDDMSAADFVPPFSSRKVSKNDQVFQKM